MNIGVNSTDRTKNNGRSTTYILYYTTCYVDIAVQYYLWIWKYYTESTRVYSLWSLTEGLTQCLFQHWLRRANEPIRTVDSNIHIIRNYGLLIPTFDYSKVYYWNNVLLLCDRHSLWANRDYLVCAAQSIQFEAPWSEVYSVGEVKTDLGRPNLFLNKHNKSSD